MPIVAGVDGCRGGWLVARLDTRKQSFEPSVVLKMFYAVLALTDPAPDVIALDLPIGLPDVWMPGGRPCDRAARTRLGRPRASSVFSPPIRRFLTATCFDQVSGLSRQAFGILPKITEVDRIMTVKVQSRVHEAHPELAFWRLRNEAAARYNKKTVEGREERLTALASAGHPAFLRAIEDFRSGSTRIFRREAASDDLLDAYALTWTALRIVEGRACRLPDPPPIDAKGLRMEIWY